MRGMEFLDKLEHIDPAYLEEAEQFSAKKRRRLPKWGIALAACLALLVSAGAAIVISGSDIQVLGTFAARIDGEFIPEAGYVIGVEAERFPLSSFTGEVLEVGTEFIAQYEQWLEEMPEELRKELDEMLEENPEQHVFLGRCRRDFATAQEALDYIGFAALKNPDMGLEEEASWSAAFGTPSGQLTSVSFCVVYTVEELHILTSARIYTEYESASENDITLYTFIDHDKDEFYTTAAGKQCRISYPEHTEEGRHWIYGQMIVDGILYGVDISRTTEDADQAMELLCRWADQL